VTHCPLIVFFKAPILGTVKTRLARTLGQDKTLGLYRSFVTDVIEKAGSVGPLSLFYSPAGHPDEAKELAGGAGELIAQSGGDLGEKMAGAFEYEFSRGAACAVLMGTDVPDVPVPLIREACDALEQNQAVIGPVRDGGYFLVGFRADAYSRTFFQNIPWSTDRVCDKTLEIMGKHQIDCHVLSPWDDVDIQADYNALIHRLRTGQTQAPRTWAWIQRHEDLNFNHNSGSE